MKPLLFLALITTGATIAAAQSETRTAQMDQPVEIGLVQWSRELDSSLVQSKKSGKPVLVLFQEVPGCEGCQKFGREVLSQPLIVEAIEVLFLPVVVYNNLDQGTDAELLKRFKEPAWNYQVVRFLDAAGSDVIPRQDQVWTISAVAGRMIEALNAAKRPVPKYLETLAIDNSSQEIARAAFSMHCFWTGEYELGRIEGVVSTEAGWLDGREVTLVEYDSNKLTLESLADQAAQVKCAERVYTVSGAALGRLPGGKLDNSYRPAAAADQKKQIPSSSPVRKIPGLNSMQLTKINSLIPHSTTAAYEWLSPRQQKFLARISPDEEQRAGQ